MVCVAAPMRMKTRGAGDAFTFSPNDDATSRSVQNVALLLSAPWMAYWAFAFEALNPENYRR